MCIVYAIHFYLNIKINIHCKIILNHHLEKQKKLRQLHEILLNCANLSNNFGKHDG